VTCEITTVTLVSNNAIWSFHPARHQEILIQKKLLGDMETWTEQCHPKNIYGSFFNVFFSTS